MKIVKRQGVFETNSSSTHTLTLVSKIDYQADKSTAKPRYRHYRMLDNKEDKLFMACGCCEELFAKEEDIDRFASWGNADDIERKRNYDEIKDFIANGNGKYIYMWHRVMSYELAISLLVRVYCQLTNEDYDKTYARLDALNRSGRACHMKFFDEGALYDAESDYDLIDDIFNGDEEEVTDKIRRYFDDDFVLCYIEYYSGIRWDKKEDDDE